VTRALVLAAGRSTRIQSVACDRPKPLIEVAGRAALDWNLAWLAEEGVRDVWINLHYRADAIRAHVGSGSRYGLDVRYSFEPEILGTAGAVRRLGEALAGDDFFVLYGDNVTRTSLAALLAAHQTRRATATIGVFDRRAGLHSGIAGGRVLFDADGAVREFAEAREHPSPYVNAGVYALAPSVFDFLPPDGTFADFARDVFPDLLAGGRLILAHTINGFCFGIDTPDALAQATEKLSALARTRASQGGPR
jgi:mannose-1-phosphate guanylyltransferase